MIKKSGTARILSSQPSSGASKGGNILYFFDANRYSSIFSDKAIQNKEIGSQWLASWRDSDFHVRHDLLYKAETNNQAEYGSMLFVLHHVYDIAQAQLMGNPWLREVTIIGDSQLVIRQMQGEYKVKEDNLRPLWLEAVNMVHVLEKSLGVTVTFDWVRREINNKALKIEKKIEHLGRHNPAGLFEDDPGGPLDLP